MAFATKVSPNACKTKCCTALLKSILKCLDAGMIEPEYNQAKDVKKPSAKNFHASQPSANQWGQARGEHPTLLRSRMNDNAKTKPTWKKESSNQQAIWATSGPQSYGNGNYGYHGARDCAHAPGKAETQLPSWLRPSAGAEGEQRQQQQAYARTPTHTTKAKQQLPSWLRPKDGDAPFQPRDNLRTTDKTQGQGSYNLADYMAAGTAKLPLDIDDLGSTHASTTCSFMSSCMSTTPSSTPSLTSSLTALPGPICDVPQMSTYNFHLNDADVAGLDDSKEDIRMNPHWIDAYSLASMPAFKDLALQSMIPAPPGLAPPPGLEDYVEPLKIKVAW